MKLVIFGSAGSGKGTYASRLEPILKIVKISTGDMFREFAKQGTDFGKKVEEIMKSGQLVPDEIVIKMLKERIGKPDAKKGFILDGFPRTVEQAKALDKITKIDALINLIVPEDVIIARLSTREFCSKCGRIYNKLNIKPKVPGVCDICGGSLIQREDDKPQAVKERLKVHEKQIKPVLDYYKGKVKFLNIKCNSVDIPPEIMVEKILEEMKKVSLINK